MVGGDEGGVGKSHALGVRVSEVAMFVVFRHAGTRLHPPMDSVLLIQAVGARFGVMGPELV
jgi:hypothetical protein